jgi:hypothetical protein
MSAFKEIAFEKQHPFNEKRYGKNAENNQYAQDHSGAIKCE